jgi:hypothetical protein
MRPIVLLAIALCAAVLAAPWRSAAADGRYALAYEILLAGLAVGEIEITATLSDGRYHLLADTRNTGVLQLLAGFTSRAESRGDSSLGVLQPRAHWVDNVWVGERRSVRNSYGEDGVVITEITPTAKADGREAVPQDRLDGTVDPLTAGLAVSLHAGGPEPCRGRIPVFDGRRRYDLSFRPTGREAIDGPFYEGTSIRCRVSLERIAGFSRDPWLPRAKTPEEADLWFARVAKDAPAMPVMFQADMGLGIVEINLVSFSAEPPESRAGTGELDVDTIAAHPANSANGTSFDGR